MTTRLVLDHGFVRLVSYTQPVPISSMAIGEGLIAPIGPPKWTGDLEIARATRNKPEADWRLADPEHPNAPCDEKLLRHMQSHDHTSPFEFMDFTFFIQAPLFVLRQWHRHRTWSYSEFSARYSEMQDLFYVPTQEAVGHQSTSNHQSRVMEDGDLEVARVFIEALIDCSTDHRSMYEAALERGVPRELARLHLPMNVYTTMYAKVDLHNLLHFLRLRLDKHAQYEIRVYARAILELIRPIVPVSVSAWEASLTA